MYAKLDIGISSDVTQPVVATVTSGPLAGAKLIGSYELTNSKIKITFTSINSNGPTSSISAIGLDGDTASAAIEGNNDYHITERYGLTFLTEFMSGLGSAITTNASTTTTTTDGSTTTTSSGNDYSWDEYMLSGLGAAGTALSDNLSDLQSDIPTISVTVPSGKLLGVLLTSDFEIGNM